MSSPKKAPQLKPGDLVAGRFRVVEPIGSGGFSVVYRAHQEAMNRFVALKILKADASSDEKIVERFRREALFASHLSHPNTITLFDYGHTDDGLCYIAMEYLTGTDLAAEVQNGESMELDRVWSILVQSCRSLAEAHRLGLIHRDLKPENIFLVHQEGDGEFVKVLDFGVSKAISNFADAGPRTMAPLTQEGTVFGTPLYMAPEQAMAEGIAPSVDVYALGHIAYEMITGKALYADATNAMDVMLKQINDPPLTLPEPWKNTPFSPLITKCTHKEPSERIEDASKLLEHLMHDAFTPYMDAANRPTNSSPMRRVSTGEVEGGGEYTVPPEADEQVEEVYRWELDVLDDALEEARDQKAPRLVTIRGAPGTGRSNLLRAFLRQHKDEAGVTVAHRQSHAGNEQKDAGLEADLACVTKHGLEGLSKVLALEGGVGADAHLDQLQRMLHQFDNPEQAVPSNEVDMDSDSAPLSALSSHRDTFLARIMVPFREAAEQGVLIWGLENLEKIDTLTLAFLNKFFTELRRRPAPILIVATVSPDDLMRRPGLLRYTQGLLQATRPVARQLSLVPPGERKEGEAARPEPPEAMGADNPAAGSFLGDSIPTLSESSQLDELDEPSEIFDDLEADEADEERSEADLAFDTVLGFLAQLGDRVPEDLWKLARARVVPDRFMQLADFIIEQAERFGIVHRREDALIFTQPGFAEELREGFDELVEPVDTHRELAKLMREYYEAPGREHLRTIAEHLRKAQAPYQAMQLLRQAGEEAFGAYDLDSAREYYLQIRQLMEEVESGRVPTGEESEAEADFEAAKVWLRLGEIHGALGEHGAAEDAIGRALDEKAGAPPELRGRAFKILGDLAVSQERYSAAKTHYRRARDSFREAGHPGAFVAAMGAMGHCALRDGKAQEAEEIVSLALEKAARLNNEILSARLRRFMGQVLTRQGRYGEAVEHLETSMKTFEAINSQKEVVEGLRELGDAAFAALNFDASRHHFTRAISLSSSQHLGLSGSLQLGLARALAAQGNLEEAGAHLSEALVEVGTSSDRLQEAYVHFYSGDVCLAQSQFGKAMSHFQQVAEIAKSVGHTELWLDASLREAYVAFDSGDAERAYRALGETMERAEQLDDASSELQVRAHVIYLQLVDHNFSARGDTFASLVDKTRDKDLVRARVLCQVFKSDVHAAHGEVEHALSLLEQARRGAPQIGDYGLLVPLARREYLLKQQIGRLGDVEAGEGWGLAAIIPPEIGRRRFDEERLGQ